MSEIENWLERAREHAGELAASAPPLTDDQRERLRVLWNSENPPGPES